MKNPFKRTFPARLGKYLFKRNRRPRLKKQYINDYDKDAIDKDIEILMMTRHANDVWHARELLNEHEALTAMDVLEALPNQYRWKLWQRVMNWLRRIEGSFDYDPVLAHMGNEADGVHRVKHKAVWAWEQDDF